MKMEFSRAVLVRHMIKTKTISLIKLTTVFQPLINYSQMLMQTVSAIAVMLLQAAVSLHVKSNVD
jgi:hypothetical protein